MASRSLNKVMLVGNLTRDPELRYTPSGTAVCTFGVATNRSWTSSDSGERQEETEFHRIVAWQKLAELCAQLLFKGRKVYVEGRLQTRTWTGKDNQERTTTEIVIDNMIVLDSKRKPGTGFETGDSQQAGSTTSSQTPVKASTDDQSTGVTGEQKEKKEEKKEPVKTEVREKAEVKKQPVVGQKDQPEVKEEVKADDIPF
jgi:single-strand DNA-binding protein